MTDAVVAPQDLAVGSVDGTHVDIFMREDPRAEIRHTAIHQMAAEALHLPVERVRLVASDTATSPGSSGSVSASRTTFMAGNAVRRAAAEALERWREEKRPDMMCP